MNDVYKVLKNTYMKKMMDIFVILELDIKSKAEFKDHKGVAHKLLTDIVNEHYLDNSI